MKNQQHKDIEAIEQLRTEIRNAHSMGKGLHINSERLHFIDAGLVLLRDSLKPVNANPVAPVDGEQVNHPSHYGGEGNPYEAIKIIEAHGYGEGFCLGNALKYLLRAGKKRGQSKAQDLAKSAWYSNRAANPSPHLKDRQDGKPTPPFESPVNTHVYLTNTEVLDIFYGQKKAPDGLQVFTEQYGWIARTASGGQPLVINKVTQKCRRPL